MRNIKLLIEYEGTGYQGWQVQKSGPTVQSTMEAAIRELTGEACSLTGAGRTDAGVHALGQVAAFRTRSIHDAPTIKRALNALLPPDIRVMAAADEDESFHPRFGAKEKSYFYLIANTAHTSPFVRRFVWHVPQPLDMAAMTEAAKLLVGKRDFSAFMAAGSGVKDTVRELREVSVEELDGLDFLGAPIGGRYVRVRVRGDGFLRHMVRNIAGTLVDAARGKIKPEDLDDILASGNRSNAGPTAPACGLFLESVNYVL